MTFISALFSTEVVYLHAIMRAKIATLPSWEAKQTVFSGNYVLAHLMILQLTFLFCTGIEYVFASSLHSYKIAGSITGKPFEQPLPNNFQTTHCLSK